MTSRYRLALAAACVALLGLMTPSVLRADNLVQNGDFSVPCCIGGGADWTVTPAAQGSDYFFGIDGATSYTIAGFGAGVPGYYDTISQTLTTQSGYGYTISFLVENLESTSSADFQVLWDGTGVLDIPGTDATDLGNYTLYSINVDGAGSDTLGFEGYNPPSWYYLTDVSVSTDGPLGTTPEPSSLLLLGPGLLGMCWLMRRRLMA